MFLDPGSDLSGFLFGRGDRLAPPDGRSAGGRAARPPTPTRAAIRERREVHHPLFARVYIADSPRSRQARGEDEHRAQAARVSPGRVVEVGAGTASTSPVPEQVEESWSSRAAPARMRDQAAARRRPQIEVATARRALPPRRESCDAGVRRWSSARSAIRTSVAELLARDSACGELRFTARRRRAARRGRLSVPPTRPSAGLEGVHGTRHSRAIERASFTVDRSERFQFTPGAPCPALLTSWRCEAC